MQPIHLREKISQDEFDYQTLIHVLAEYAAPRDKVTSLLRQGVIIRVKKGIYVFGKAWRRHPYSLETLANLIYGPSYISLEYALHFYGLIPEQVCPVTSVTPGRSRRFTTPVGDFTYLKISMKAFASGMDLLQNVSGGTYLVAVPEKALIDKVQSERGLSIRSRRDVEMYLVENLRMDIDDLARMDLQRIREYAGLYCSAKARSLVAFIRYVSTSSRQS